MRAMRETVDGIECKSGFVLMEVELIEPVRFLGLGNAANRLAEMIVTFNNDHYTSHQ
jgi:hypothetical protein